MHKSMYLIVQQCVCHAHNNTVVLLGVYLKKWKYISMQNLHALWTFSKCETSQISESLNMVCPQQSLYCDQFSQSINAERHEVFWEGQMAFFRDCISSHGNALVLERSCRRGSCFSVGSLACNPFHSSTGTQSLSHCEAFFGSEAESSTVPWTSEPLAKTNKQKTPPYFFFPHITQSQLFYYNKTRTHIS